MSHHKHAELSSPNLGNILKVHNLPPTILFIMAITGTFYTLITKIEVLNQRVTYNELMTSEYKQKVSQLEEKYTDLKISLSEGSVKGASTLKVSSTSASKKP